MWLWVTLFLLTVGIGLVCFAQTTLMIIFGAVAMMTGFVTLVLSIEEDT